MNHQLALASLKRQWLDEVDALFSSSALPYNFTSDDLHEWFYDHQPHHHNAWGMLLARWSKQGKIEHVGYRPSKRKEANGRIVSIWKVK